MRLLISSMAFVMVAAVAGNAAADTPLALELSVEPVTNSADLDTLMRQNTVRVALQRHRLWQEAADRELVREAEQSREATRTREQKKARNQRKPTGKAAAPATGGDLSGVGDEGAEHHGGDKHHNRQQKGASEDAVGGKPEADRTRLRDMLREQRKSGGGNALEKKLEQRLREHRRQTHQVESGKHNRKGKGGGGSGGGMRKRSGR